MEIELRMPDLATTGSPMRAIRWLVEVGQQVKRGQPILEIETDKAAMELEAIAPGRVKNFHVNPDDTVDVGQLVATLEAEEAAVGPAPAQPPPPVAAKGGMFARNRATAARGDEPAIRAASTLTPAQRAAVRRMQASKQSAPHFYLQTSASAERLIERRKASALLWDACFVHAAAKALARFERMGFRYANDQLQPCESDAIGVAVDHDGELFVIAVASPASKSPEDLSSEIRASVDRLRAGDPEARRLQPARMTISNLGSTGVESFTAILNPPEAAILAIGRVAPVGVVSAGQVVPQSRVALTLSVDHRVVNGKYAADFLQAIVQEIETL
ncbi:MAG TPA: 2-oxo acid dehydrogenase subunit E2 [Lacunisphaera sp.]|jgi:pyruvate dehydrogenase E2 component (dihydrolipoamide acetyltransferase)|nr:2-oxo acid dehydrogenase subunit E2 [Lacunisphaera sp.]